MLTVPLAWYRIPIVVQSMLSLDDLAGAKLRIDDQYLALDPGGSSSLPALTVSGAQLQASGPGVGLLERLGVRPQHRDNTETTQRQHMALSVRPQHRDNSDLQYTAESQGLGRRGNLQYTAGSQGLIGRGKLQYTAGGQGSVRRGSVQYTAGAQGSVSRGIVQYSAGT